MGKLTLEFLGSGTSVGVPVIGCDCAVCQSTDARNQRLRSSVLVRGYDDSGRVATTVVIDTTPDFRQQMLRSKVRHLDAVIITHYHADHVVGIDDVRRFNALQRAVVDCWATPETLGKIKHSFGYIFGDDLVARAGLPSLRARPLTIGETFNVGNLTFEPLLLDHTVLASTGFRIRCGESPALAYCIDVKRIPPESYARLAGTHTLVLDMLRERLHTTHMNRDEALAATARIAPRRTYFSHIAHEVDHAPFESRLPEGARLAFDGLVLEL